MDCFHFSLRQNDFWFVNENLGFKPKESKMFNPRAVKKTNAKTLQGYLDKLAQKSRKATGSGGC